MFIHFLFIFLATELLEAVRSISRFSIFLIYKLNARWTLRTLWTIDLLTVTQLNVTNKTALSEQSEMSLRTINFSTRFFFVMSWL